LDTFSWKWSNCACAGIGGANFAYDAEQNSTIASFLVLSPKVWASQHCALGSGAPRRAIAHLSVLLRDTHDCLTAYRIGRLRKQVSESLFYEVLGRVV
jgi:hypothetical protein